MGKESIQEKNKRKRNPLIVLTCYKLAGPTLVSFSEFSTSFYLLFKVIFSGNPFFGTGKGPY